MVSTQVMRALTAFAGVMSIYLLCLAILDNRNAVQTPDTYEIHITYIDDVEHSPENVWNYIHSIGIQHPAVVYAQYVLESGSGTSYQATYMNNLLGMQVPSKRIFVGFPMEGTVYAAYTHWKYSVIDYALWQSTYAWNLTESEYLDYLSRVYATDSTYIDKIKKIINLNNREQVWERAD